MKKLTFRMYPGHYCIYKMNAEFDVASLLPADSVVAMIRDNKEITVVAKQIASPQFPHSEARDADWIMFHIEGEFAFGETGIVLSAISPLSNHNIGVFVLSTYSSDLLMIKASDLEDAKGYLRAAGHEIL